MNIVLSRQSVIVYKSFLFRRKSFIWPCNDFPGIIFDEIPVFIYVAKNIAALIFLRQMTNFLNSNIFTWFQNLANSVVHHGFGLFDKRFIKLSRCLCLNHSKFIIRIQSKRINCLICIFLCIF